MENLVSLIRQLKEEKDVSKDCAAVRAHILEELTNWRASALEAEREGRTPINAEQIVGYLLGRGESE